LLILAALACSFLFSGRSDAQPAGAPALSSTIAALDRQVFDAFNHCDLPGRLEQHAGFFDPDVEFYHDTGGVTWTRDDMLANTRKYVCGRYRRELLAGSLQIFPVKDFGAIEQGTHRFCGVADNQCEGLADFTIVWRLNRDGWRITRVLSYGHRSADAQ
jgi:hypothetical protein